MIVSLYKPFQKWTEIGTAWIYSDPHFNDPEMKYLRKSYIGDDEQIARINAKVGKKDTIIILGDIGDIECVKKLRGYKVLIMGNHDSGATNYMRQQIVELVTHDFDYARKLKAEGEINIIKSVPEDHAWLCIRDNQLFDEVYEGPLFISEKVLLSHEPICLPFAFNIHGHDHSGWNNNPEFYHLNVCAEHIDYTPVSLNKLFKNGFTSKVDTIHRETIDTATARKKKREGKAYK